MTVADKPSRASAGDPKDAMWRTAAKLANFDEEALRNSLIQAAGNGLLIVAESSEHSIREQVEAVRRSATDVDDIFHWMSQVVDRVQMIDAAVSSVVCGAQDGARELQEVDNKIRSIANQFQQLSETTTQANREIKDTLGRVRQAIEDLSQSVGRSVRNMRRSIESINTANKTALPTESETTRLNQRLQDSLRRFRELADSSGQVESEIQEVTTIGSTFGYLLEMMAMQGAFREVLDPLARLFPLVKGSTFYDPHRFTANENEYVLTDQDVVISATDPHGIITLANDRFFEIAEYAPVELIGKQHNTIRHPDMPKAAFADLWTVIKAGKTWQGYVKDRSKTGRGFWLKANVFPCFEHGNIVGYISIRTRPSREKVRQAIEVYRRVP